MPPSPSPPVSSDRRTAVAAHAQRLAVVLEVLVLLALLSGAFPLTLARPVWWLRLADAAVALAPVMLLAVILLRFASLYLRPDTDTARTIRRRTLQLTSRWAIVYGLLVPIQLLAFAWLWADSGNQLSEQLSQASSQLGVLRNRLDGAASEAELQRVLASTPPGLLPPLGAGSLSQQRAQLGELLDLSRARLQTNLTRRRTATLVNAIPGILRGVLGAAIVGLFLLTVRRSLH